MNSRRPMELILQNIELMKMLIDWEKEHKPTHYDRTSFRRVNELLIKDIEDEIARLRYEDRNLNTEIGDIPF